MSLPKAFLTNFSNVTVSQFSLFSVCLSLLFLSSDSEGMWSFSQDLTAILVKQEPSLMSENCPDTSPPLANTSTCSHPLTLAPPPQRNHTGEKVKHGHYTSNLENRHLEWNTCTLSQVDVILVWISIDVIELMMVNLTHTAHQRDHCISMTMKNMRTNVLRVLFCSSGSLLYFSAQWTCSQCECECEELNLLKHGNRFQQHQCWAESRLVICGCWDLLNLVPDSLWTSEPCNCSLLPDLTLTQARLSSSSKKLCPLRGTGLCCVKIPVNKTSKHTEQGFEHFC